MLILTMGLVFSLAPRGWAQVGAGATLVVLGGSVTVTQAGAVTSGRTGLTLSAGDQVATAANGRALVTLFDGSEVELDNNATLQITEASAAGAQTRIGLNAVAGSTIHKVIALSDPGSSYRVTAGTSVLLVRGTTFGHRADPVTGDVTMALAQCGGSLLDPQDCVDFPAPGQRVQVGEKVTARTDGTVVREPFNPGTPLFNTIQSPAGSVGSSAPSTTASGSADTCVLAQVSAGKAFAEALAECAVALAPTATPIPPPPPTAAPAPPPVVVAAVAPLPVAGPEPPTFIPTMGDDPADDDDSDDNENSSDDDDDDDRKKPTKKNDDKKSPPKPTTRPGHT